jgi:hypothetical protein
MIEPDINERMARFAPSQNMGDPGDDAIKRAVASMAKAPARPQVEQDDAIHSAVLQMANERRQDMAASLMAASQVNPDQAARASKLGEQFGVGQDIALRNMQELEREAAVRDIQRRDLMRNDPVLARYLSDRAFASEAQDDVGMLAMVQPLFMEAAMIQARGAPALFDAVSRGYQRGKKQMELGEMKALGMMRFPTPQEREDIANLTKEIQDLGRGGAVGIGAEMIGQYAANLKEIGAFSAGGAAIGSVIPGVGTAIGGGLGLAAGILKTGGTPVAGNLYNTLNEKGVSDDIAIPAAIAGGFLGGLVEVVGGKIAAMPVQALAKRVMAETLSEALTRPTLQQAAKEFVKAYGLQVGGETFEEGTQAISEMLSEEIALAASGIDSELTMREGFMRVIESALYGAAGSAILGGVGPGANLLVDLRRASNSERQQKFFEGLTANNKESRLAQRSPVGYERFLASQAEGTTAETIYVDGRIAQQVLAQSGVPTAQLEEILPGIRERISEAVQTGGDVTIPTARFGARLANTDLGNALLPHMRLSPDAMSATEAQEFATRRQEVVREAEQILAQKQEADATFVQEAQQIHDRIRQQAIAAGQEPAVADVAASMYQAFVVTQAAEEKITPAQVESRRRRPLTIEQVGELSAVAQTAPVMEIAPGVMAPVRPAGMTSAAYERLILGEFEAPAIPSAEVSTIQTQTDAASTAIDQSAIPAKAKSGMGISVKQIGTALRQGNAVELANALWKLRERMSKLDTVPAELQALAAGIEERLASLGITIDVPQVGAEDRGGQEVERVSVMPNKDSAQVFDRIKTVLAPVVRRNGAVISRGQVVVEAGAEAFEEQRAAALDVEEQRVNAEVQERMERVRQAAVAPGVMEPAPVLEQAAMSTRVPTAVKPLEDALNDVLLADFPTFLRDEKFVAKNLAKFKELNAPIRIDEKGTEQQQLDQIIEHMTSNLLWLHDAMEPAIRERARMWYVGGRRLVDWMAERHGMSPMAAATVFAVLSPQKNWYENVGLGIRITDIVATQGATTMDADMQDAYLSSLRKEITKKQGQLAKQDEAKPKRGKKELAAWEEKRTGIADELKAAQDKVAEAQGNIDAIGSRTLADVLKQREFFLAAIMVRWFDQTKNDRTYPVISPEGGVGSPMLTEAGTPASIRYGSYNEVAKAIAAYVDGRAENVHYLIGGEHKVRNFYNNLFNPEDPRFATIDTHAIAAAYLMPLAGTDKLVQHGLGGGVGNAMFGMGGGYAVFYEAYRRAAEARGIQPREMQSITWEAIRGMFEAAMKGGLKAPVAATWKQYVNGEIDLDTARADVMQRSGGITTPSWVALPRDMEPAAGYEGVSRTAADAQAKRIAAQPTAASIMFEVAPDPADAALVKRWEAMSPQQRQAISVRVAEDIIPRILREYGVAADMVMQVGGWEGATNVGFALRMPPGPLVRQIAQAVGYALSQQAVFSISATEFSGSERSGVVVLQLQPGTTVEQIADLYETKLHPLGVQGHATLQDAMLISLDPKVDASILANTIAAAVAGDDRVVEITHDTAWRSLDDTRVQIKATGAKDEGRRVEGDVGRRRVDVYRSEATRLVAEYLGTGILEQAAAGPARGGFDPRRVAIMLTRATDRTTMWHELVHFFLNEYTEMVTDGSATARTRNDLDLLLKWFKIEGDTADARFAKWVSMSLEEQRKHHEALTYNAEIYAFEGKAPSAELVPVFERLRAFMLRVYKSIRDDLNAIYRREFGEDLPILTGEVRQVMDRMLATDEQIKRQAAINEMKPQFQTQEQSGMDDAEWAAYQAMQQEAIEASITDMNKASMRQLQWLGNARSRILRDMQKKHDAKRKEVAAEVAAELRVEPVYRAMTYLRTGKFIDSDGAEVTMEGPHRLDTKRTQAIYAGLPTEKDMEAVRATGMAMPKVFAPDIAKLGTGKYGMLGVDGLDPDVVAETFGFGSGDQMIRALLEAKPMKEAVAERTDAEMLRRYGDMNTPEAQEAEVQKALHNEARARFVAVELRHVARATEPVRVMLEAAKQVARELIAGMTLRDVRPGDFIAAEARAARDAGRMGATVNPEAVGRAAYTRTYNERIAAGADEATAVAEATTAATEAARKAQERSDALKAQYGADPQQALIRAKRAQLYQNQLAAEALRVREEVAKQVKYLRRILRDTNVKAMGAQAADQVAALLERFEVAPVSLKRLDERKALAAWLAEQEAAGLVPDIAPEVADEARRVNYQQLTVAEFRDLVDAIRQIEFIGKNERKVQLAAERAAYEEKRDEIVTRIRAVGRLRGVKFDPRSPLTNIGRSAAALRGFAAQHLKAASVARILDGGEDDGPLWTFAIRSANAAADMETRMRAEASAKLAEILAPVFALGNMGGKGVLFPSINRSLNREARLAIAMNVGNDGNRQRLLDGEGWTMEQVQPVLESLTEAEWKAVQQVWDYIDTYRPLIAEKERRLYGKEPEWVKPTPFTTRTADGREVRLEGGYYPIKYDPIASDRVATVDEAAEAKRALDGAYTAATTRRSFVKSRVREVVGRPLLYTLDAAFGGVNDVIHDLAWHEWLIQTQRLLRDPEFANAVRETRGPEYLKQLRDWTKDNAAGERKIGVAGEAALSWLRQGISASGLGFNVVSAAMQVTGFNQSIVRLGAKYVGRGVAQFAASPIDTARMVADKSSFMAERGRTQFREINEIRNRVRGQTEVARRVTAGTYFLMMNMQRTVDIPTWLAGYQKALDAGKDDATAVALADQAVRDTQGSGLISDLAAIERGGPMMKLFTVFYSYMNTVYNMTAVQTMTARSKGKLAADYAMLLVVPVVLGQAIKNLIQPDAGDDELDPEALARKLAAEELSFLMGTMVIAREFGGAAQLLTGAEGVRMGYGGPAGLRAVGEVYGLATQAGQLEFDRAFRRSAINTLGAFTGLPSAQVNRTIDGIEAVIEGEVEGVGAVVAPLTGVQR